MNSDRIIVPVDNAVLRKDLWRRFQDFARLNKQRLWLRFDFIFGQSLNRSNYQSAPVSSVVHACSCILERKDVYFFSQQNISGIDFVIDKEVVTPVTVSPLIIAWFMEQLPCIGAGVKHGG